MPPGEPLLARAAALSTRPDPNISLDDEFDQACIAANHGRTAVDGFNAALLDAARARWPDRWTELVPETLRDRELGRLRHRRAHRYRLVGHPALPPRIEADAARPGDAPPAAGARDPGGARPHRECARRREPPARRRAPARHQAVPGGGAPLRPRPDHRARAGPDRFQRDPGRARGGRRGGRIRRRTGAASRSCAPASPPTASRTPCRISG